MYKFGEFPHEKIIQKEKNVKDVNASTKAKYQINDKVIDIKIIEQFNHPKTYNCLRIYLLSARKHCNTILY